MLKAFLQYRRAREQESEALFLQPGWATPSTNRANHPGDEYVSWSEVQSFIQMAEQALAVRNITNEHLRQELAAEKSEKNKVQLTSSAAQEESSFLTEHMQSLLDDRSGMKEALDKAQRQADYLLQENELLRQELLEGVALGEESSAAIQLLARQQEELRGVQQELRGERQRNAQLENDNVQLQARVSALERAHTAQATAMLSCLEESERTRLQQLSISIPDSPLAAATAPRRANLTSDGGSSGRAGDAPSSTYTDALELGSDGSFASCQTPGSAAAYSGGSGGGGGASIFRSNSPSPSSSSKQHQRCS